jgi:hypothetical protein
MESVTPGQLERAMAVAAVLAGDHELLGLRGAAPGISEPARAAAGELLAGPREETSRRVAAELTALLGTGGASLPRAARSLFGLRRLVCAVAAPEAPPTVPGWLAGLSGEAPAARLVELSVALLRAAAQGERWAVRLTTRGAARLSRDVELNPRLALAVAWIGAALERDRAALEALAASWPGALAEALRRSAAELAPLAADPGSATAAGVAEVRRRLEEELRRHG